MKFLEKPAAAPPEFTGLHYSKQAARPEIRRLLCRLQNWCCAYSEAWLGEKLDSEEIEHFNDGLKSGGGDDFFNWYAVLRRVNQVKMGKHWADFQPLPPAPYTPEVQARITYSGGTFVPADESDTQIHNLIAFTGANDYPMVTDRRNHISRLKWYREVLSEEDFVKMFEHDPTQLSFPTAIERELGLPAFVMLEQAKIAREVKDEAPEIP